MTEKSVSRLFDESHMFFENGSRVSASAFVEPIDLGRIRFSIEKKTFDRALVIGIVGIEGLK